MIDDRLPVLVGGGQITNRAADLDDIVEPTALMTEALRRACADAGRDDLLGGLERIVAIAGTWSYPDPAAVVGRALGASQASTALSYIGGQTPQTTLASLAEAIQAGDFDVAAVVGAEAIYGRGRLRAAGRPMVATNTGDLPACRIGSDLVMSDRVPDARGFDTPANVYPLFEDAIRTQRGETRAEHGARVGRLWERFNRVAVDNRNAWVRTPMSADEIITPSPSNRMVGFPYTKAMNSNWFVDQGAAVVLCSVAAARRLGVARDRWVFVHSAAAGSAPERISERHNYWGAPAVAETGRAALSLAGLGVDDIARFDLYSCFPSMVQLAMAELGIADDDHRPLTLTGGLTFFGGPFNNYVTHSLAEAIAAVRSTGETALVHANGGYATKQAFGVYGPKPPAAGFRTVDCQATIDRYATREFVADFEGEASIEAATVLHTREGPEAALVTALTPGGARAMGRTEEPADMVTLMSEECGGQTVNFNSEGAVRL